MFVRPSILRSVRILPGRLPDQVGNMLSCLRWERRRWRRWRRSPVLSPGHELQLWGNVRSR